MAGRLAGRLCSMSAELLATTSSYRLADVSERTLHGLSLRGPGSSSGAGSLGTGLWPKSFQPGDDDEPASEGCDFQPNTDLGVVRLCLEGDVHA